jgi:predicted amidohydrolase
MKVAAAQTLPKDNDILANIADHIRFANGAADQGASLIVFPEMSLTGYLMETAQEHAFIENDVRLQPLQQIANERNIIIAAGAPLEINSKLYIGKFIIQPGNLVSIYTKQFLHEGEERFYTSSFDHDPILELSGQKLSFAICADINNPLHSLNASKTGTTIYIAGIYYRSGRVDYAHEMLGNYAQAHNMHVLMANYAGPSHQFTGGGMSAYWNNKGELVEQLDGNNEGLLIAEL